MSIYKYVSPESGLNPQIHSAEENTADDSYEYFSDPDEAETYKKSRRNKNSKAK